METSGGAEVIVDVTTLCGMSLLVVGSAGIKGGSDVVWLLMSRIPEGPSDNVYVSVVYLEPPTVSVAAPMTTASEEVRIAVMLDPMMNSPLSVV